MRVTTSSIIRNYKSNLSNSVANLEFARTQVMNDGRKFDKAADDPAAAARSSQLRRKYQQNTDYISMVEDVQSRQSAQESAIMQISNIAKEISKDYNLEALNGTNGPAERAVYATSIREFQKSMVLSLNSTYEDEFVFAGGDGLNPPFKLSEDGNTLFYRGIDVNDAAALEAKGYNSEKLYVDLGFGLTIDGANQVVSSSAFDTALPGINVVGYGEENGMSNNIIVLAGQLATELESGAFDSEKFAEMSKQFDKEKDLLSDSVAQMGIKSKFLDDTKERLKDNQISLNTQINSVENISLPEALTNYSWAQYAYNAALRVGTNILSPSFIDFMK